MEKTGYRSCRYHPLLLVILLACVNLTSLQISNQGMPPEIRTQINNLATFNSAILVSGVSLNLEVDADGTYPLRYVWRQNGIVVANDSLKYYRIQSGVNKSNEGTYTVTVGNSFGQARSLPFTLVVKERGVFPNASDTTVNVQVGKFTVLNMPEISYVDLAGQYSVDWEQNDGPIPNNNLKYYVTLDHNLALLNIPLSLNQSRFRVKFTHRNLPFTFDTYSQYFILSITESSNQNVLASPEFVVLPRNTSAKSDQSRVQFECAVNGQPLESVQINWYKNTNSGRTAIAGNDKYAFTGNNTFDRRVLTINSLSVTDGGTYECEGSLNTQTVNSQGATLTVSVPPSVSSGLSNLVTLDFQESAVLPCVALGSPQPNIKWYFNAVQLDNSTNTRYQISQNGTLTIMSVDLPDSGVYQCFATNEAGGAASYIWLVVNSAPPTILEAPKNVVVAEHEDTSFMCKVKGGPQPDVYWKKDGINVTIGGRIRVPLTLDQLLIGQAEKTDSGVYSCNAVNIQGAISANATLNVIGKTQITKPPQNMSRIVSTNLYLDCGVTSDPSVKVNWSWYFYPSPTFQKLNITSGVDNAVITSNGSLMITYLQGKNSGKYECVVTSAGGNDQRVATLDVIYLPDPPVITQVSLNDNIPNSVLITWTQGYDGDTPITKFIIQSRRESSSGANIDSSWTIINSNVSPNSTSSLIINLLPSRYYRFRITAVNKVGESIPSNAAPQAEAIKMPAQPPSSAPVNVFCDPGQDREIIVTWESPPESSWNGDLQGYIIYFKIKVLDDDTERFKNISGKDIHQTVVDNLIYHKEYRVRMAAYNEKGPGVNSSDFTVTTREGVPDYPPQNVTLNSTSSTTIRIDWEPPPSRVLNGDNKGYVIQLKQDGYLKDPITVHFNEQNTIGKQTFLISNLTKYTQYEIQITCRTAAGPGPYSPPQTVRTLADVPGPVADLLIDNISDRTFRVNWKPPLELNGILTGYEVSNQVKNSTLGESYNRTSTATSHTFTNLLYETKYVVSVRAMTEVGLGPARTTEITSGVPPELPGQPTGLAVSNIEAKSVLLQFFPGFDGKTSITLWIVEAQVEGNTSWVSIYSISDPTANQITVYNLHPYFRYRLRIKAQNIVGISVPSDPCNTFQTMQAAPGMPPQDITPRVNSSTSIRIRWRQIPRLEWNGDTLGYKIYYRRWSKDVDVNTTSQSDIDLVREATWSVVELSNGSSIQEYFLSKLEEWMDYQIQMVSYNAVGNSSASPILSERTDEDVPSASPGNLVTISKSSTFIFVGWSPVPILQQNGIIQGYKVKYLADRTGSEPQYMDVAGAKSLNVTLTGLWKFTKYSVQAQALTRVGDGVLSIAIAVTTASDVPGPPIIIYFPQVNATAATVVWQSPEEPNGILIKYNVAYKKKDQPDSVLVLVNNTVDLPPTVFQYTVTGLASEIYYVFYVRAKTEDGWGEAAMVDVYTIANRDRPDQPISLRIDTSEILTRSVSIVWTSGNDNYGPVRNYTIQYRKRGENWQTVEGTIKPLTTSYKVNRLLPNTWYSFRVAAVNDIGASDFSAVTNEVQTLPDKPDGSPQNVKISAVTRTSIKITWDPPPESTWNGQLVSDIVQYREEGTEAFRDETVSYGQFNSILQKLTIGVRYEIQVLTSNDYGRGPPSILQVFYVGDVAPFAAPLDVKVTNKSSTELEITWKPPPDDTTNGGVIAYKIHYWQSATENCMIPDSIPNPKSVTEPSIVLGGLKPYTIYCSTVQAVNIAGEGPQSMPLSKQTSEAIPGPPEHVRFQNITLRELNILWDEPSMPNGKITRYELGYSTVINNITSGFTNFWLAGEKRQQYVSDLLENQQYTFTLVAVNNIGNGTARAYVVTGPQPGSPYAPLQPKVTYKAKTIYLTWTNPEIGNKSKIQGYTICYLENDKSSECVSILDVKHEEPSAQIALNALKPSTGYRFVVRSSNVDGISPPSVPSELYTTPSSLIAAPSSPFHTQWWFLVIVALSGVIVILLIITLLCRLHKSRKKDGELKRSTTVTTVMSATPEPEDNRYPALELRQSTRSVVRNGKVNNHTNNMYARSPPRPSPASVIYSEGLNLPVAAGGVARKPRVSDDTSSVLSEKPSNLDNSSDDVSSDDSDNSSTDSIVKVPVPSSPPPPAFSSHYGRSSVNYNRSSTGAGSSGIKNNRSGAGAGTNNRSSAGAGTNNRSGAGASNRSSAGAGINNRSSAGTGTSNHRSSAETGTSNHRSSAGAGASNNRSGTGAGIGNNRSGTGTSHNRSGAGPGVNNSRGSAGAGSSGINNHNNEHNPPWKLPNSHNAYTYTDSEADSSHYAFSLNNGNIVVNNVAGARTPLSGFSSFV